MEHLVAHRIPPGTVQDYKKEASGRCKTCNSRFIWPKRLGTLKKIQCPFCFCWLYQTTHLFKGDTIASRSRNESKNIQANGHRHSLCVHYLNLAFRLVFII